MKAADSRYLHRPHMDWEKAQKRKDPSTPEGKLFQEISRMESLRREHRVFDTQADIWLVQTGDDNVLGIGRYYQGEKLVALFNFSEQNKDLYIDELGDFSDLMTGETKYKYHLSIPSGDYLWLICDFTQEKKEYYDDED